MTKEEILEGNKLIAEFMGFGSIGTDIYVIFIPSASPETKFVEPKDMRFECSWDWLMPVVSKCLSILDILLRKNIKDNYSDEDWKYMSEIAGFKEKFKWSFERPVIENCFKLVVEFIEWYKQKN